MIAEKILKGNDNEVYVLKYWLDVHRGSYGRGNHKLKWALKDGKGLDRKSKAHWLFFPFLRWGGNIWKLICMSSLGQNNERTPAGAETWKDRHTNLEKVLGKKTIYAWQSKVFEF